MKDLLKNGEDIDTIKNKLLGFKTKNNIISIVAENSIECDLLELHYKKTVLKVHELFKDNLMAENEEKAKYTFEDIAPYIEMMQKHNNKVIEQHEKEKQRKNKKGFLEILISTILK